MEFFLSKMSFFLNDSQKGDLIYDLVKCKMSDVTPAPRGCWVILLYGES
jgi:hypothetical protein